MKSNTQTNPAVRRKIPEGYRRMNHKDQFIVRPTVLSDNSVVFDIYFVNGQTDDSDVCIYNAYDQADADRTVEALNKAIGATDYADARR